MLADKFKISDLKEFSITQKELSILVHESNDIERSFWFQSIYKCGMAAY